MKLSDNNKRTLISVLAVVIMLLIWGGERIGKQYIIDNFVKYDVEQMINVSHQIPDPVEKISEQIVISKKWIDQSVIVYRNYPNLSVQEGVKFYSEYAKNNGWTIESSRWDNSSNGNRFYYLDLKKGNISCYIIYIVQTNEWEFWIQKD